MYDSQISRISGNLATKAGGVLFPGSVGRGSSAANGTVSFRGMFGGVRNVVMSVMLEDATLGDSNTLTTGTVCGSGFPSRGTLGGAMDAIV